MKRIGSSAALLCGVLCGGRRGLGDFAGGFRGRAEGLGLRRRTVITGRRLAACQVIASLHFFARFVGAVQQPNQAAGEHAAGL